jgi:hypothetical protein
MNIEDNIQTATAEQAIENTSAVPETASDVNFNDEPSREDSTVEEDSPEEEPADTEDEDDNA